MKKRFKNLSVIALVCSFLLIGCTSDQETTKATDGNSAKSKLTVTDANWVEIGHIKDGTPVLTIDTKKAVNALSQNMKTYAGIEENYTNVYVVSIDDGAYNLLFEGKTYRTSFYVEAIKSNAKATASASHVLVANRKITCTTSDCAHESTGCAVKYDHDNNDLPYCSPCNNGGKCTKTDISTSDVGDVATGVF